MSISFILQLCYVVIGSCLRTIVVAYHEFHTHSKTLHQQVTMGNWNSRKTGTEAGAEIGNGIFKILIIHQILHQ